MRLRRSKFAFRLRRATKNASPEVKICVSPAQGHKKCISAVVFPAQGHTKRVSGAQNLRFACAKRSRGSRPDCFPCAGPHKTRLRSSKFAFRLRRATKSDDKDASETLPRISAGLFSLRRATQNASPELKICVSPAHGHKIG